MTLNEAKERIIRTLELVGQNGCEIERFEEYYRNDWSQNVPYAKLGFSSTVELLSEFPDISWIYTNGQDVMVRATTPLEEYTILSNAKPTPATGAVTISGYALQDAMQQLVYNTILDELRTHMHIIDVVSHIGQFLPLTLTLEMFNEMYFLGASSFQQVYETLYGDAVVVLKTKSEYRLAYLGNDGAVPRNLEDFVNVIRERKKVTVDELFECFVIGNRKALRSRILSRILRVEVAPNGLKDGLQRGLPADLIDLTELDNADTWELLKERHMYWIGDSGLSHDDNVAKKVKKSSPPQQSHDVEFWKAEFLGQVKKSMHISLYGLQITLRKKFTLLLDLQMMNQIFGQNEMSHKAVIEKVFGEWITITGKEEPSGKGLQLHFGVQAMPIKTKKASICKLPSSTRIPPVTNNTKPKSEESHDIMEFWKAEFLDLVKKSKSISLCDLCTKLWKKHAVLLDLQTMNRIFGQNKTNHKDLIRKVFEGAITFTGTDEPSGKRLQLHFGPERKSIKTKKASTCKVSSPSSQAPTAPATKNSPKSEESHDMEFWKAEFLGQVKKSKNIYLCDLRTKLLKKYKVLLDLQTMNRIFGQNETNQKAVIEKIFGKSITFTGTEEPSGKRLQLHFGPQRKSIKTKKASKCKVSSPSSQAPAAPATKNIKPKSEESHDMEFWKAEFLGQVKKSKNICLCDLRSKLLKKYKVLLDLQTMNRIFGQNETNQKAVIEKIFGKSITFTGTEEPSGKLLQLHFGPQRKSIKTKKASKCKVSSPSSQAPTAPATKNSPKSEESHDMEFWKAEFLGQVKKSKNIYLCDLRTKLLKKYKVLLDLQTMNRIFGQNETNQKAVIEKIFGKSITFTGTEEPSGKRLQLHFGPQRKSIKTKKASKCKVSSPSSQAPAAPATKNIKPKSEESHDMEFWKAEFLGQVKKSKNICLCDLRSKLLKKYKVLLDLQTMNRIFGQNETNQKAVIEKIFGKSITFTGTEEPSGKLLQLHFGPQRKSIKTKKASKCKVSSPSSQAPAAPATKNSKPKSEESHDMDGTPMLPQLSTGKAKLKPEDSQWEFWKAEWQTINRIFELDEAIREAVIENVFRGPVMLYSKDEQSDKQLDCGANECEPTNTKDNNSSESREPTSSPHPKSPIASHTTEAPGVFHSIVSLVDFVINLFF